MNFKSDFDLDLATGVSGENSVKEMLLCEKVEVKTDFMTKNTGNIAVEFESRGKPSGIAVTKADHWVFHIPNKCTIIVETMRLKELSRKYYKSKGYSLGGDNMTSKLILIPFSALINV
jgi:hypothetical protein